MPARVDAGLPRPGPAERPALRLRANFERHEVVDGLDQRV